MVIKPKQVLETILEDEQRLLNTIEERVDNALMRSYDGTRSVWISTSHFSGLRKPVREHLLSKYRTAGWDIRYQSDQRDGDAYIFRAQTRSASQWDMHARPYE